MADSYVTSYCNYPHNLKTGRPIGHVCYVLPPEALAAERAGDNDLALRILQLGSARFKSRGPVQGRRAPVVLSPTDSRYDKTLRYLKKHRAYLVTLQDMTASAPGLYDVTPEHGDRALPKGIIEKAKKESFYGAFLYSPSHAASLDHIARLGNYPTLDDAVEAILSA